MSYVKTGKKQKNPGKTEPGKSSVNDEKKRHRETEAQHRRMRQQITSSLSMDAPREQDHLPGSAEDRFGQVYRKGGSRDGVDVPTDSSYGRGFATPENR